MNPIVGSIVALVTPMHEDGSVDYAALRRLIDWHIAEGTDCIGVVGTTGESPTVSMEENCEIIRVAVEQAAGRVPIMAGTGANATSEAIELTRYRQEGGRRLPPVGGALLQPAVAGRHLPALPRHRRGGGPAAGAVQRARPHRGRHAANDTVAAPGAGGPASSASRKPPATSTRAAWLIKQLPKSFCLYSGDDGTAVALMLLGGRGNVSVTANVAPRLMHELCMAAIEGQVRRASEIHLQLLPLHRDLFCEPSPAPAKWAMAQLGLCGPAVRLPIVPLTAAGQATGGPGAARQRPALSSSRGNSRRRQRPN